MLKKLIIYFNSLNNLYFKQIFGVLFLIQQIEKSLITRISRLCSTRNMIFKTNKREIGLSCYEI